MDPSKPWYTSKTIWGALIALLSTLAGTLLHISVSTADQASLVDAFAAIGTAVGSILAVYGRTTATHKIGS